MEKAEGALAKAITVLMITQPFFGSMVYSMRPTLTRELPMKSAATDGRDLFVDPDYAVGLYRDELAFVIAHEVLHVVSKHHSRRNGRDPELWNYACDAAINPILAQCPGLRMPKGLIFEKRFEGKSAEEIYAIISKMPPDEQDKMREEFRRAAGVTGIVVDPEPAETKEEQQAQENRDRDFDVAIQSAAMSADMAGKLPGGLKDMVRAATEVKVSWQERLRHALGGLGADDYTWSRFSRAGLTHGVYLPSVRGYACGTIITFLDTSGSVSNEDAALFLPEVNAVVSECRPETFYLGQADTDVHTWDELEDELPHLNIEGRGGTDFHAAFEFVEDQGIIPDCLIYMSDLDVTSFPPEPDYPVIWLCNSKKTAPYGEVIYIEK